MGSILWGRRTRSKIYNDHNQNAETQYDDVDVHEVEHHAALPDTEIQI